MIRTAALVFLLAIGLTFVDAGLSPFVEADLQVRLMAQAPAPAPAASGKDILGRKCFQCHQASMWASVRLDRREWESTLYRMVGRGALWTEEEVSAMASFLAETRGPEPKAQSPKP